ncbi:hypothetical protein EYF80_034349 [Liparis tanakae]|uniref:Uncharacterized protein n=1 Tax=Liparis tanakae TaxID=230148 RepID=A0A4Z2GPI4_9TELE|nr:hypothetical protein EYF80_034349 [Liparis tanakae]
MYCCGLGHWRRVQSTYTYVKPLTQLIGVSGAVSCASRALLGTISSFTHNTAHAIVFALNGTVGYVHLFHR